MKKGLFVFLVVISSVCEKSFAQSWEWAKSGNGTGDGECWSVCTDKVGNVFISGYFYSPTITFGTYTLTNNSGGYANLFIAKYDANGIALWAKSVGGINDCEGGSVSTDTTGNVLVTGWFSGNITFGSYTLTNTGTNSDVFIAKYDGNGNMLWAKSTVGTGGDYGWSVSTDATSNVFITGWFSSPTITIGTYTLTNSGSGSVFITKYDANGNVLWAKNAGGTGADAGYSVSTDATGNVFLAGTFSSPTITFGTYTLTNATASSSSYNVFIAKYDATGNVLWAKSAGGIGADQGWSVSTDATGNVFVTGGFSSSTITFGTYTLTNAGTNSNVFIAKYDAIGNVLWAKSAGGLGYGSSYGDVGYCVSTDTSSNVFVTGGLSSPSITFGTYTLSGAVFLVKYDANGNVLCASALTDGGDDNVGVSADRFGNAYIAGDFVINPFIIGSDSLTGGGGENIFVAKWTPDCNKGGIEQFAGKEQISVYPNPASTIINLTISQFENAKTNSVEIYNTIGNCVHRQITSSANCQINIADLSEGVYTISITTNEGVVNKRLVIVR